MATVDSKSTGGTFSSKAIDLIDCFSSGFDELLSDLALRIALQRSNGSEEVEISEQDIVEAASLILRAVEESALPTEVKAEVSQMFDCVASRSVPM